MSTEDCDEDYYIVSGIWHVRPAFSKRMQVGFTFHNVPANTVEDPKEFKRFLTDKKHFNKTWAERREYTLTLVQKMT